MNVLHILLLCIPLASTQANLRKEKVAVVEAHYAKRFQGACEGTPREGLIDLGDIQFCDIDMDGVEEAIVNGSSCVSGTGGPDIHEVLKLNANGTISDLTPIEGRRSGDLFRGHLIFDSLVGSCNHDVSYKNGLLYYVFRDSSGKPEPLILKFKWKNKKFQLIEVVKNGLTPSSSRTLPP